MLSPVLKLSFRLTFLYVILIRNNVLSAKSPNQPVKMKMVATLPSKEITTAFAKAAAVPSIPPDTTIPTMAKAAGVPSIPPDTTMPTMAKAAGVPSIPPDTTIPTMAKAAGVPSIPPDTTIPTMAKAAGIPSIPPDTTIPTMAKAAAVPSIPPDTTIPTMRTEIAEMGVPSIPPDTTIPTMAKEAAVPSIPPDTTIPTMRTEIAEMAVPSIPPDTTIPTVPMAPDVPSIPPDTTIPNNLTTDAQLQAENSTVDQLEQSSQFLEPLNDNGGVSSLAESSDPASAQTVGNAVFQVDTNDDFPSYTDVKSLYAHLLNAYDSRVRPKVNQSELTQVSVFFSLLNILDFKTSTQTLDILGYFYFRWEDKFLTWKPSKFSRIKWVKIPKPEIWTPLLTIANMYSGNNKIGDPTDRVLVTYKGKVSWVPEATYKIVCEVEIELYPFDKQTCRLIFHVSDDIASEVEIVTDDKHNGIRIDHYMENSEWRLINASVEKYFVNEVSYMDVIFVVQRRLEFILFTTVAPLLLVSVLNVCAFLIPVESEEKGEYSATIVITYGVFISHISASVPPNSTTIPYFLLYMIWLLGFSVSTVIYSIIQSRLFSHYRNRRLGMGLLTFCFGKKVKSTDVGMDRQNDKTTSKIVDNIEEVTDKERKILICGDMLKKLDIIMIVLYILSIFGTTAYFFFSMDLSSLL